MKTLFIIDDDPGPLQSLTDLFEGRYVVLTATDINMALAQIVEDRTPVDLIITDFHVGRTGEATKLVHEIRQAPEDRLRSIPIAVVSAEERQREWAVREGCAFFAKPINPIALATFVEQTIGT